MLKISWLISLERYLSKEMYHFILCFHLPIKTFWEKKWLLKCGFIFPYLCLLAKIEFFISFCFHQNFFFNFIFNKNFFQNLFKKKKKILDLVYEPFVSLTLQNCFTFISSSLRLLSQCFSLSVLQPSSG